MFHFHCSGKACSAACRSKAKCPAIRHCQNPESQFPASSMSARTIPPVSSHPKKFHPHCCATNESTLPCTIPACNTICSYHPSCSKDPLPATTAHNSQPPNTAVRPLFTPPI